LIFGAVAEGPRRSCVISKTPPAEVLLVTSRETKRWIIPKGWPIKIDVRRDDVERDYIARRRLGTDIPEFAGRSLTK